MTQPSISWDAYFMALAMLVSLRSKDPSSKVGAVLVRDHKVIGTGYNGFPSGCDESRFSWDREVEAKGWLNTKYPYVIHAEANALLNTVADPHDSECYVTLYPCNECAKLLIQGGIRRVTYLQHKYPDMDTFKASLRLFEVTGIEVREFPAEELALDRVLAGFTSFRDSLGK